MYKSLYVQMAYVIVAGIPAVLTPNFILTLSGFAPTTDIWIRVLGLLLLAVAPYYYTIAKYGSVPVAKATVWGRYFFSLSLLLLVGVGIGPLPLVGLAVSEIALAAWTDWEIRRVGQ